MNDSTDVRIREFLAHARGEALDPLPWGDVESRAADDVSAGSAASNRSGLWLAAAAIAAIVAGGVFVIAGSDDDDRVRTDTPSTSVAPPTTDASPVPQTTVVTEPTPTTVPTTPAPTTAPTTTEAPPETSPVVDDPTLDDGEASAPAQLSAPVSGETQQTVIGDITWTILEGDASTQPDFVSAAIDGTFMNDEFGAGTWVSPNGIDWELVDDDSAPEPVWRTFDIGDETWAVTPSLDGRGLGRWDGTAFVPLDLPPSLAPTSDGLDSSPQFTGDAARLGDLWVIPVATRSYILWHQVVPAIDRSEWDAVTETIRLYDDDTDPVLPAAILTAEFVDGDPSALELRDADTGELVRSIDVLDGMDRDEFFDRMILRGGAIFHEFLTWDGEQFSAVESPWPNADELQIEALGDALLAVTATHPPMDSGDVGSDFGVWTSDDLVSWTPVTLPTPVGERIDWIDVESDGSLALLTIVSSGGTAQQPETWSTVDAIEWAPTTRDPSFGGTSYHSGVGWFRGDVFETGGISVSSDGLVWQDIPFDIRPPFGAGGGGANVYGGKIFVSRHDDGGPRTLWVGEIAET